MGLRPARTIRVIKGQNWSRMSQRKPRKSFIKGAPRPKVRQYDMGVLKQYDVSFDVVAEAPVAIRDNSIEAARQAMNRYLDAALPGNYFFKVLKYPHFVLREHAMGGVAGADRISKGMKLAFGKPKGRSVHLNSGEPLLRVLCYTKDLPAVKEAYRRGKMKLSGQYYIAQARAPVVTMVVEMKKITEVKPTVEAAPAIAGAAAAPGAPAATAPTGKEEKSKK